MGTVTRREEVGLATREAVRRERVSPTVNAALRDPVTDAELAVIDHSHVLNIRGESYRLREKKRAGLFGGAQPQKEVMKAVQTQP